MRAPHRRLYKLCFFLCCLPSQDHERCLNETSYWKTVIIEILTCWLLRLVSESNKKSSQCSVLGKNSERRPGVKCVAHEHGIHGPDLSNTPYLSYEWSDSNFSSRLDNFLIVRCLQGLSLTCSLLSRRFCSSSFLCSLKCIGLVTNTFCLASIRRIYRVT